MEEACIEVRVLRSSRSARSQHRRGLRPHNIHTPNRLFSSLSSSIQVQTVRALRCPSYMYGHGRAHGEINHVSMIPSGAHLLIIDTNFPSLYHIRWYTYPGSTIWVLLMDAEERHRERERERDERERWERRERERGEREREREERENMVFERGSWIRTALRWIGGMFWSSPLFLRLVRWFSKNSPSVPADFLKRDVYP